MVQVCLSQARGWIISRDIQGLSFPGCLRSEAGHIHPFCRGSSWFICLTVIQPPGWTVYQHVGFLLASQQDLLWISWDHPSCCAALGHHPPLSHTLLPSEFQLTSICHPTHFIGSEDTLRQTQDHFYHSFKKIICIISARCPPLITQFDENQKHMTTNIIRITADTKTRYYCATYRRRGARSAKGIKGSIKLF